MSLLKMLQKKLIYVFAITLVLFFSSIKDSYSWTLESVINDFSKAVGLKKTFPLQFASAVYREDNLLGVDRYRQHVFVSHTAPKPVSGRIIIRAYGDVFGEGGIKSSSLGNNYQFFDLVDAPPGRGAGVTAFFYINNSALQQDNLSDDTIKKNTTMRFKIEFQPAASEKEWSTTTWTLEIRKGQLVDLGD